MLQRAEGFWRTEYSLPLLPRGMQTLTCRPNASGQTAQAVFTQGNRQICFLKLHYGQRRISLAEIAELLAAGAHESFVAGHIADSETEWLRLERTTIATPALFVFTTPVVSLPRQQDLRGIALAESDSNGESTDLKTIGEHLLDMLKVITFAIGAAIAGGMFLVAVDVRNGGGHAFEALVWGSAFGLFALCGGGLRYAYPALEGSKEKGLAWLIAAVIPVAIGICTVVAFVVQLSGIRFLGFEPASWHEVLAKGMTLAAAVLMCLLSILLERIGMHYPWIKQKLKETTGNQEQVARRKIRVTGLGLLCAVVLVLPAKLFPGVVAVLLAASATGVGCLWIAWKRIVRALSNFGQVVDGQRGSASTRLT